MRVPVHYDLELRVLQHLVHLVLRHAPRLAAQGLDEVQTRFRRDELARVLAEEEKELVDRGGARLAEGRHVDLHLVVPGRVGLQVFLMCEQAAFSKPSE